MLFFFFRFSQYVQSSAKMVQSFYFMVAFGLHRRGKIKSSGESETVNKDTVSGRRHSVAIRGCIQKFRDWPPGARTANGTALCH